MYENKLKQMLYIVYMCVFFIFLENKEEETILKSPLLFLTYFFNREKKSNFFLCVWEIC